MSESDEKALTEEERRVFQGRVDYFRTVDPNELSPEESVVLKLWGHIEAQNARNANLSGMVFRLLNTRDTLLEAFNAYCSEGQIVDPDKQFVSVNYMFGVLTALADPSRQLSIPPGFTFFIAAF